MAAAVIARVAIISAAIVRVVPGTVASISATVVATAVSIPATVVPIGIGGRVGVAAVVARTTVWQAYTDRRTVAITVIAAREPEANGDPTSLRSGCESHQDRCE